MKTWVLFLALMEGPATEATRLNLHLQEGQTELRYIVDIAAGAIRVEPEGEEVHLILETAGPTLTVVFRDERFYCRLTPQATRRLVAAGLLRPSWLPWVYRVSPDLVEEISMERKGRNLLEVFSKKYTRLLARYEWQPGTRADLFFQWRESYLSFWGEDDARMDGAERKRLDLYAEIGGLPLLLEERFGFISRPRTLRLVSTAPAPRDPFRFRPPADFPEKSEARLRWEAASRRILDWLRPRDERERRPR